MIRPEEKKKRFDEDIPSSKQFQHQVDPLTEPLEKINIDTVKQFLPLFFFQSFMFIFTAIIYALGTTLMVNTVESTSIAISQFSSQESLAGVEPGYISVGAVNLALQLTWIKVSPCFHFLCRIIKKQDYFNWQINILCFDQFSI